jgi:hypothetical protein
VWRAQSLERKLRRTLKVRDSEASVLPLSRSQTHMTNIDTSFLKGNEEFRILVHRFLLHYGYGYRFFFYQLKKSYCYTKTVPPSPPPSFFSFFYMH